METITSSKGKSHLVIAWILLTGLLFLRFPFLVGGVVLFNKPSWLEAVFQIGTYLLTACLIWWDRDRLTNFNIDMLALCIIIIFKPIQTLILSYWGFNQNPLAFPNPPSLIIWIISIGLVIALWLGHAHLPKLSGKSFGWFGLGILVGLIAVLAMAYPMSFQIDRSLLGNLNKWAFLKEVHFDFTYQLGYAAVTEEPLFRGFLWGYLSKAGWKTVWIWLFQAGLFMLGHLYYIAKNPFYPYSFWLIVPVGALILGALVWRSKTISSSMAAHATMNSLGMSFGIIVASWRI